MLKVMIVDDEELERKALKVVLKDVEDLEVVAEGCNGREAVELDKEFEPDLIIMDVKMPGLDGCKAAEIIKGRNKEKMIIMITAHDDFELVRRALVIGVNDYVLKPVRPKDLIKNINNMIVSFKINDNSKIKNSQTKNNTEEIKSPIENALSYIDGHVEDNINLDSIAAICNLSPCYFSKLFKKEVGVNFKTYINDKKIEKAKEVLKSTDTPILNIAIDLGFDDCGYFIRVFKKVLGVTPKKYREINS
ncbi:MAG: response regulator [Clostridium sp.]|uniref:response regulator n=1 Tax=Clostridium sp. TaxID=1506 RepID=UPI002FCC2F12